MAVVLQRVISGGNGRYTVEVLHGGEPLIVELAVEGARDKLGQYLFVELDVERIEACVPATEPSGIVARGDKRHRLVGVIHSQMEIGDGTVLYDLYIETGPDYFCIDSSDVGGAVFKDGDRLAVDVVGLCFVPTGT